MPALVLIGWGLRGHRVRARLPRRATAGRSLFVGIALLVAWAPRAASSTPAATGRSWSALVLGLIGLADVADSLPFTLDLAVLIPLALIGAGVYLIWRLRRTERHPRPERLDLAPSEPAGQLPV